MNAKIEEAFNKQINMELFSSYLYLSMSTWAESQGFSGMAHWLRMQVQEETAHGVKFIDFIHERDGRVVLTALDGPKTEWSNPLELFKEVCSHEAKVTDSINSLVDLSIVEKDHAANSFLQWFVTEQVEEEATARDIRDKLKLAGDSGAVLYMIDQELAARPAPATDSTQG